MDAFTLFDSGANTVALSTEFAGAVRVRTVKLDEPVKLGLGTRGSNSSINYGAYCHTTVGTVDESTYFDIVNLQRYDAILGTPFLIKHKIDLLFSNMAILFDGKLSIPSIPDEAGLAKTLPRPRRSREVPVAALSAPKAAVSKHCVCFDLPPWDARSSDWSTKATHGSDTSALPSISDYLETIEKPALPADANIFAARVDRPYTRADLPKLREKWKKKFEPVYGPPHNEIPLPGRGEVNHEIHLKDPSKAYAYRTPRCPDAFRGQLTEKIQRYADKGLWVPCASQHAIPLLCIPKNARKQNELRTVVDARERNLNSFLNMTPLPDQDILRDAVARYPYRTKIDMKDAFEQI